MLCSAGPRRRWSGDDHVVQDPDLLDFDLDRIPWLNRRGRGRCSKRDDISREKRDVRRKVVDDVRGQELEVSSISPLYLSPVHPGGDGEPGLDAVLAERG